MVEKPNGKKEPTLPDANEPKRAEPQAINAKRASAPARKAPSSSGVVAVGFAFAGGCGTNNARRFMASMAPEEFPYLFVLVANTDGPQLKEFFDPSAVNHDLDDTEKSNLGKWIASIEGSGQLTIVELGESGNGAGGDPEIGRIAAEDRRDLLEQWMKPLRTVILSGGAGKGTGGGALPIIQKIAKDLDKCPLTIVTMPFAYEGGGRMKKAVATLKALYEQGPTMPIYNENVPIEHSKGKGFREVFNEINNASIQPVFFGIREVTQVVGDMQNVDIADWRKVLNVGNYVTCDYAKLKAVKEGAEGAEEEDLKVFIERLLLQDPYQDHRTRKNATGILAWTHGSWNPDEVKSVIKVASDDLNAGIAEDLEVFQGIHIGTDGAKWMMILSVASKSPDPLFFHKTNGTISLEARTAVVYVPVEGQNTPAEVMVHHEIAERWNALYHKRFEDLSHTESQEFGILATAISAQSGKKVSPPRVQTRGRFS